MMTTTTNPRVEGAVREWVVLYKPGRRLAPAVWAVLTDVPASATTADVVAALEVWPRWPQWQARVGVGASLTVARRTGRHHVDGVGVGRHSWDALKPARKRIGLDVSGELHAAASRAARAAGVHLSVWCLTALLDRLAAEGVDVEALRAADADYVDVPLPGFDL